MKGSFITLLLGVAILVISYAFPFFLIPLGSYSHKGELVTTSYSFAWNSEMKTEIKVGDEKGETKSYYKINDKAVYISLDKDVKVTELNKLAKIKNIYTLEIGDEEYKNYWALGFTIIGYVLTAFGAIGIITPKKRR